MVTSINRLYFVSVVLVGYVAYDFAQAQNHCTAAVASNAQNMLAQAYGPVANQTTMDGFWPQECKVAEAKGKVVQSLLPAPQ